MSQESHQEVLQLIPDEDLEDEVGWHRGRAKHHRWIGNYGLARWHDLHVTFIMDEMRRREDPFRFVFAQLQLPDMPMGQPPIGE